jgi:2'-5' RNA ligase
MPPDGRTERCHRLFFALWPTDSLRVALAPRLCALQPRGVGRPQSPQQWHVTLEFLGPVPASRVAAAQEAAEAVRAGPFELVFDAVEHWRRPEVLCLVASEVPPALDGLVRELRAGLAARGFLPERRAFRAHLTLARKLHRPVAVGPFEPLRWTADEFALVESVTERAGSRYTPLARWPLRAGASPRNY